MRIQDIKDAVRGRWIEIVGRLYPALSVEKLKSRIESDCPKCGGNTRFRAFNDFNETGGMHCSHCFSKGADGIDAISWLLDCSKKEAMSKIGECVGLANGNGKAPSDSKDPAKHLEFTEYLDALLPQWCKIVKPGVSPEAAIAFGARTAKYRKDHPVIAFPILGPKFETIGWTIYDALGGQLPYWTYNDKTTHYQKVLITSGSKAGLMGPFWFPGSPQPKMLEGILEVWKCEGPTDAMALFTKTMSSNPALLPICNSNGAGEEPKKWIVDLIKASRVRVIHDADAPGEAGAAKWCRALVGQSPDVRQVRLPFEVTENKGKDLRDYLNGEGILEELLAIAEATKPKELVEDLAPVMDGPAIMEDLHLKLLQMEVLYEDSRRKIKCYSKYLKKTFEIKNITRESRCDFIQNCGRPAQLSIVDEPGNPLTQLTIEDAREAVAMTASQLRKHRITECGSGIWLGRSTEGEPTNTIVLVGSGEAARINGDGELKKVDGVRVDGLVLDMSESEDWYEFEALSEMIKLARDVHWRRDVVNRVNAYFGQWKWMFPGVSNKMVTALILSTWVQSVWKWRPQVSVVGASQAGKSLLFSTLQKMFGKLSNLSDRSTEAGIRQYAKNSSKIIIMDEFGENSHLKEILNLIRTASRGGKITRGTSGQEGIEFGLKHICWIGGTETGLERLQDINRFINFELLYSSKRTINEAPDDELAKLGQETLAVAIASVNSAISLCSKLSKVDADKMSIRQIDLLAVPAAMISAACEIDPEETLRDMLSTIDPNENQDSDESSLINEILSAMVDVGRGDKYSVGQILQNENLRIDPIISSRLNASGVIYRKDAGRVLFASTVVKKFLVPSRHGRIEVILKRFPTAKDMGKVTVAGSQHRCVSIEIDKIINPQ